MSNFDRGKAFNKLVEKVQSDESLKHINRNMISEFLDDNYYAGITEKKLLELFDEHITWVR